MSATRITKAPMRRASTVLLGALAASVLLSGCTGANPRVRMLANNVAKKYETMDNLSFQATVTQTSLKRNGDKSPPSETATATVAMKQGGKLRLTVIDPTKQKCVLNRVSNGTDAVDWNDKQRKTVPPCEAGNVHIDEDFDFCHVGGYLESWLGKDRRAVLFKKRIGSGTYRGTEMIDGTLCDVVDYKRTFDDDFMVLDSFYIDPKEFLVRQWTTMQAYVSDTGNIISHVTRQRRYFNIRTDPIPEETFALAQSE